MYFKLFNFLSAHDLKEEEKKALLALFSDTYGPVCLVCVDFLEFKAVPSYQCQWG